MIKVFYLSKVQYKFESNEVTGVWIQCNHCNKTVACNLSETVTIDTIHVFIK